MLFQMVWEIASPITDEHLRSDYTLHVLTQMNLELTKDLFLRMFWIDPKKRFSLHQILQHPWMTNQQHSTIHNNTTS